MIQTLFSWPFLLGMLALLPLLPLLIHLINLLRHQRVKWAAMEFLLQSHKRHRTWIWLKQLLLLLLRMAVLVTLLLLVAQFLLTNVSGSATTHYYVLLDDSYSMSDDFGSARAFDRAKQTIGRIARSPDETPNEQRFTLIRFSQAAAEPGEGVEQVADLTGEFVYEDFDEKLTAATQQFDVTQLSVGPQAALSYVAGLIGKKDQQVSEKPIVYVVSDFRTNEWSAPAAMRESLTALEKLDAEIHLVDCAGVQQSNLGIVSIEPEDATRAAGVPLFVRVKVHNYGRIAATKVQVGFRTHYYDEEAYAQADPLKAEAEVVELPKTQIDNIDPGGTADLRVQVYFPQAGQHVVEAFLPDDAVAADNRRWCVVDFPAGEPVLVIDGSATQREEYFLTSAFQPGQLANTGVRPDTDKTAAFLRDATAEQLQAYRAIYLLDVARLDGRAVTNLEEYVRGGGGLAFFVGPNVDRQWYSKELYKNGEGLFPLPLERDDLLPPDLTGEGADIAVEDHPLFDVFLGERNPLISLVSVERYLRTPRSWRPPANSGIEVIARLRNRMPLVVENKFGEGRVVATTTTVSPDWNNWARGPSFVVYILKLQSYLASARRERPARHVGEPIKLQMEAEKFGDDVALTPPSESPETRIFDVRKAKKPSDDSPLKQVEFGVGKREVAGGVTDNAGVYEVRLLANEGPNEVKRFALNVEPNEGSLALADLQTVKTSLNLSGLETHSWEEYRSSNIQLDRFGLSLGFLILLILLLIVEPLMAYIASEHPPRGATR